MLTTLNQLLDQHGDKLASPLVVTVRTYNYVGDTAAYTATVQLKSGAALTVAASGARRLQVGYQTGQHARALLALEQAGYTVRILCVTWTGKAANIGEAVRKAAYIIGIDSTWRGVPVRTLRGV